MVQSAITSRIIRESIAVCLTLVVIPSAQAQPNILLITADDMGQTAGCYGDHTIATPAIDRLASQGMLFKNAYVTQASCSPSRSSMFTGLYPHQNGQLGLAHRGYTMHRGVPTLQGLLKQAGYRSFVAGKVHVEPDRELPFEFVANKHDRGFNRRDVAAFRRHLQSFLNDVGDDSWFALASFTDPHKPYGGRVEGLPVELLGPDDVTPFAQHGEFDAPEIRTEAAGYYNAVKRVDHGVGLLMDLLEKTGHADDTLVIFIGDHGPPVTRGKTTVYEFGTRIPFIVRWPNQIKPGQVHKGFVSTVDIVPTCLTAAGIPLPSPLSGRSLNPFYQGEPREWREYLFTEFTTHGPGFAPQRAVRDNRYKFIHNLLPGEPKNGIGVDGCPIRGMLNDRRWANTEARRVFRLMEQAPEFELYDLHSDPLEYRNLAGDAQFAEVEDRLKSVLLKWRQETKDPLLDQSYFDRLRAHTKQHSDRIAAETTQAKVAGKEPPYNKIDMREFQETWQGN